MIIFCRLDGDSMKYLVSLLGIDSQGSPCIVIFELVGRGRWVEELSDGRGWSCW